MTDSKPPQTFEEWRASILHREVYQTVWSLAAEAFAAGIASQQAESERNKQFYVEALNRGDDLQAQLAEKEAEIERLKQTQYGILGSDSLLARYEAVVEAARKYRKAIQDERAAPVGDIDLSNRRAATAMNLDGALAGLEKKP